METKTFKIHAIRAHHKIKSRKDLFQHVRPVRTDISANDTLQFLNDPSTTTEYGYIVVVKKGSEPLHEYIIHYRPGCPNTARAVHAIDKLPNGATFIMHSANDTRKNQKLRAYLAKEHPGKPVTYPRIFTHDGKLVGGASELIESLQQSE